MESLPTEFFHTAVGVVPSPVDIKKWLAALLVEYQTETQFSRPPCLNCVPLEAVVNAVESARPALNGRAEIRIYQDWITENDGAGRVLFAAWFNLGVALAREGDSHGAAAAYRKALELKPDFYASAVNLGLSLEALGQTDAALQIWDSADRRHQRAAGG